jgi:hypothetical protein
MSDPVRDVLASEIYETAFRKVMTGTDPALLDEPERDALRKAKQLAGTTGPGYPMPVRYDPTRSDD